MTTTTGAAAAQVPQIVPVPQALSDAFASSLGRVILVATHSLLPLPLDKSTGQLYRYTQRRSHMPARPSDEYATHHKTEEWQLELATHRAMHPAQQYRSKRTRLVIQELARTVSQQVAQRIQQCKTTVAFVLLLSMTDLLCCEELMRTPGGGGTGVEVHVLLVYTRRCLFAHCAEVGFDLLDSMPMNEDAAKGVDATSDNAAPSEPQPQKPPHPTWRARLATVLRRCIVHHVTRDDSSQLLYQTRLLLSFNRRVARGLSLLRAAQLDAGPPVALCVLETIPEIDAAVAATSLYGQSQPQTRARVISTESHHTASPIHCSRFASTQSTARSTFDFIRAVEFQFAQSGGRLCAAELLKFANSDYCAIVSDKLDYCCECGGLMFVHNLLPLVLVCCKCVASALFLRAVLLIVVSAMLQAGVLRASAELRGAFCVASFLLHHLLSHTLHRSNDAPCNESDDASSRPTLFRLHSED